MPHSTNVFGHSFRWVLHVSQSNTIRCPGRTIRCNRDADFRSTAIALFECCLSIASESFYCAVCLVHPVAEVFRQTVFSNWDYILWKHILGGSTDVFVHHGFAWDAAQWSEYRPWHNECNLCYGSHVLHSRTFLAQGYEAIWILSSMEDAGICIHGRWWIPGSCEHKGCYSFVCMNAASAMDATVLRF